MTTEQDLRAVTPKEQLARLVEKWREQANDALRRSGTWNGNDVADRIEFMADELAAILATLPEPGVVSEEAARAAGMALCDRMDWIIPDEGSSDEAVWLDDARAALAAALPYLTPAAPAGEVVCKWNQQDEGYEMFSTSCGHEYEVNDGADGSVRIPFCPFCARRVEGSAWHPSDDPLPQITPQPAPAAQDGPDTHGCDHTTTCGFCRAAQGFDADVENLASEIENYHWHVADWNKSSEFAERVRDLALAAQGFNSAAAVGLVSKWRREAEDHGSVYAEAQSRYANAPVGTPHEDEEFAVMARVLKRVANELDIALAAAAKGVGS